MVLALLATSISRSVMDHKRTPTRYSMILCHVAIAIMLCNKCASFSPPPRRTLFVPSISTPSMLSHVKRNRSILKYELKEGGIGTDSPLPLQHEQKKSKLSKLASDFSAAASEGFGTRARNVGSTMGVGDIVVPLCSNLEKRQSLAQVGLYAGVEYIICDIEEGSEVDLNEQLLGKRVATLKPAYPLRPHLERSDWPISLPVSQVPLWLSKATYEAGTALGTIMLAVTYLVIASILAAFLRVVVVPSESMEPALMPGDVILVTRSIFTKPKTNDVVFFNPPPELDVAIANSKIGRAAAAAATTTTSSPANGDVVSIVSTKGKHFIKRVVGVPGDSVGVYKSNPFVVLQCDDNKTNRGCSYLLDNTGEYSRPDIFPDESWNRQGPTIHIHSSLESKTDSNTLAKGQFFVAGDNGYRSVDSRVWGPLDAKYIFGTANWVVYPMQHFGPISTGPFEVETGLPGNTADNLESLSSLTQ